MRGRVLGALTAVMSAAANMFRGTAREQAKQHIAIPNPATLSLAPRDGTTTFPARRGREKRSRQSRIYLAGRYRGDGFDGVRIERARAKRARKAARRAAEVSQ